MIAVQFTRSEGEFISGYIASLHPFLSLSLHNHIIITVQLLKIPPHHHVILDCEKRTTGG